VEAARKSEADYKEKMVQVVCDAYDPIVGGEFDLQAGTLPDLEKKFRDAGVPQGQMLTKAIRFYLKALEDAGIKVSEHITRPRRRTTKLKGTKQTKKAKKGADSNGNGSEGTATIISVTPQGFERLPIPGLNDAFIQYPTNITDANCDLFEAMIGSDICR